MRFNCITVRDMLSHYDNDPKQSEKRSDGAAKYSSSSDSGSTKAPNIDACTLVTKDEADAIMGKLRAAPKATISLADEKGCSYGPNPDGANASVRVYGSNQWSLQKGIDSEEKMTGVSGLGDEAYYTKKGTDTDLWARKGGVVLNVNGSINIEKAKGMAQKALTRL